MGEAFDLGGQKMGEAFGDTKREVFDKLTTAYPTAAEIHIRSTFGEGAPSTEMPRYRCHKEVHALKIEKVMDPTKPDNESEGSRVLECEGGALVAVTHDYVRKHNPQVGGYYVVYKDGYKSFSPAAVFEEGYARI